MSVDFNTSSAASTNIDTVLAVKTANMAKSQTEISGKMALDLIASAATAINNVSLPTVGNSGHNVNIKA